MGQGNLRKDRRDWSEKIVDHAQNRHSGNAPEAIEICALLLRNI